MARYLQIPSELYERILKIRNAIKHLERELEETIGAKRIVVLRNDILALKEKLGELT